MMHTVMDKIKKVLTVISSDNAIVIIESEEGLVVDASNHNPEKVKNIAATFFKQAYNLK